LPSDLRREIEAALAQRLPGAFTLHDRTAPELAPSGLAALDDLTGGLPRGALTEIFGPASSGRTTALTAALAAATARGEACCLIDAADSFDPESAALASVALERVLWIRCGGTVSSSSFLVSRKNANAQPGLRDFARNEKLETRNSRPAYRRLEQALKAADLVLQAGFGLVILDLAGVPAVAARRVPLASWFRFRRAVENTRTVLLLVSPAPLAQSAAALVLNASLHSSVETGHRGSRQARVSLAGVDHAPSLSANRNAPPHAHLLAQVNWQFNIVRARKPPQRAHANVRTEAAFNIARANKF
jgi:hypothetical protein